MRRFIHPAYRHWDGVAAATRILNSRCGSRRKVALILALEGLPYERAELATGGSDRVQLYKDARSLGIREIHNERKRQRDACMYLAAEATALTATLEGRATTEQVIRAAEVALETVHVLSGGGVR